MGLRAVRVSGKGPRRRSAGPAGTIAYFGLDDQIASKVVVGIVDERGEVLETRRWYEADGDVRRSPRITAEIAAFLKSRGVVRTIGVDRILGCPHEEGLDYPKGGGCKQCTFWADRRG